jgi:hypothetical protein
MKSRRICTWQNQILFNNSFYVCLRYVKRPKQIHFKMAVAKNIVGKTTINILIVFILTTGNKIFVFLSLSEIFLP